MLTISIRLAILHPNNTNNVFMNKVAIGSGLYGAVSSSTSRKVQQVTKKVAAISTTPLCKAHLTAGEKRTEIEQEWVQTPLSFVHSVVCLTTDPLRVPK
jgi:hypothetical protein